MAASQAFVGAVHKQQLGADDVFAARMRERREHQDHIRRGRVLQGRARAVEQLVAYDLVLVVDDRLPGNHGSGGGRDSRGHGTQSNKAKRDCRDKRGGWAHSFFSFVPARAIPSR
ncbi:hypothetical protein D3C81_2012820 [compost metagenome]